MINPEIFIGGFIFKLLGLALGVLLGAGFLLLLLVGLASYIIARIEKKRKNSKQAKLPRHDKMDKNLGLW